MPLAPFMNHIEALLVTIPLTHQAVGDGRGTATSTSKGSSTLSHERLMSLLQLECTLLSKLAKLYQSNDLLIILDQEDDNEDDSCKRNRIHQVKADNSSRANKPSRDNVASVLLLPSLLILRQSNSQIQRYTHDSEEETALMTKLALQSMYYKCMECSATVISSFFDTILRNASTNNTTSQPTPNNTLVIQCLISCATAPYNPYHNEDSCQALDHLLGITNSLINALASLLQYASSSYQLGERINSEINGTLVARLAQMCLDVALPQQQSSSSFTRKYEANATSLRAIQTLQLLLQLTPFPTTWQRLFPGCFSGLYRVALLSLHSRTNTSIKLAAGSITALSTLLNTTLVPSNKDDSVKNGEEEKPGHLFMEAIRQHRNTQQNAVKNRNDEVIKSDEMNTEDTEDAQYHAFSNQVKLRVPGPLHILIMFSTSTTTTLSSSAVLQSAGIQLTRSILLSSNWWKGSNGNEQSNEGNKNNLEMTAIECCVRLFYNAKPDIRSEAQSTIQMFQSSLGLLQWREKVSRILCPRLIDLINELPIIARRGRETECIDQLNLINGYLTLYNGREDSSTSGSLAFSLSCPGCLEIVQKAFGVLFEPDLDAISKTSSCVVVDSSMIKNELFSGSTNAVVLSPSSTTAERVSIQTRLRYNALHLNSHHAMINAIQTARLIGKTLGTRGCAKLIYKCIVDLQHDLIDANWAKYGKGQVNWLQQSLGLLFFANEICLGGFYECVSLSVASEQDSNFLLYQDISPSSQASEWAYQLFNSLLPILLHGSIWTLPTSVDEAKLTGLDNSGITEADCTNYFRHRKLRCQKSSRYREGEDKRGVFVPEVSSRALHGNATLISEVIELVRHLMEAIGAKAQVFLPDILFPVLEKASSSGNHINVQQAALKALKSISLVTSNQNIAFFLANNFDYVADTALSRLRPTSGRQSAKRVLPPQLPGVIEVVLRLYNSFLEDHMSCVDYKETDHFSIFFAAGTKVNLVNDILGALLDAFDQNVVYFTSKTESCPNFLPMSLIGMFGSAVNFFRLISTSTHCNFKARNNASVDQVLENGETDIWLERLLHEFSITPQQILDSADEDHAEGSFLTPEAGFRQYHSQQQQKRETDSRTELAILPDEVYFPGDIILRIMLRCSFFLSFPDLMLQKSSVKVIQASIQCLAMFTSKEKNILQEDECNTSNFNRNKLLPSINQIWPSIQARLRFTIEKICSSRESHMLVKINPRQMLCSSDEKIAPGYCLSSLPFFLESLLDLVATLCEVSGDFMRSRFEHDTWPLIAKLLGIHTKHLCSPLAGTKIDRSHETEIISMLSCIRRIYSARDCGLCLAHLIRVVSVIVLPFIQFPGKIGSEAAGAIQAQMRIDRCCLFRELHLVAGRKWGPNPINKLDNAAESTLTAAEIPASFVLGDERDSNMVKRANNLISFASQLEEQLLY